MRGKGLVDMIGARNSSMQVSFGQTQTAHMEHAAHDLLTNFGNACSNPVLGSCLLETVIPGLLWEMAVFYIRICSWLI